MRMDFVTGISTAAKRAVRCQQEQLNPTKGMGATLLGWSDRYAATITAVEGDIITVQEDCAQRLDDNGPSEDQSYKYAANPQAPKYHYRRRRDRGWEQVTRLEQSDAWAVNPNGHGLKIGIRDHFFDYSFSS